MPAPHTSSVPSVYQLRVVLRGVSPLIWRRLLVSVDTSIAQLNAILQPPTAGMAPTSIASRSRGGSTESVTRRGISFRDDPREVRLAHLRLRSGERFVYDYDFTDGWRHDLRVEEILATEPSRAYPVCTGGRRTGPPEDCGGPWAFLEQRQRHSIFSVAARLAETLEDLDELVDHREELLDMHRWLSLDRFDRRGLNRALAGLTETMRRVA